MNGPLWVNCNKLTELFFYRGYYWNTQQPHQHLQLFPNSFPLRKIDFQNFFLSIFKGYRRVQGTNLFFWKKLVLSNSLIIFQDFAVVLIINFDGVTENILTSSVISFFGGLNFSWYERPLFIWNNLH